MRNKNDQNIESLFCGLTSNNEIEAVTALIKTLVSLEKCGWSIKDSKINNNRPEVNQKSFSRNEKSRFI